MPVLSPDISGAVPPWITPELMALTREVWQPYYPEKSLTTDDLLALLLPVGVLTEILFLNGGQSANSEETDEDAEEVHRSRPRQ
jgi:hypothetical protein